jgi:hypothetical protein
MTTTNPRADRPASGRGRGALVAGLVAAPIAWSLQLQVSYVVATFSCGRGLASIHAVSMLALAVAATSTVLSWRGYAPLRAARPEDLDGDLRGTRFLSLLGVFAGGLFMVAIVALWIPALVLDPCD